MSDTHIQEVIARSRAARAERHRIALAQKVLNPQPKNTRVGKRR